MRGNRTKNRGPKSIQGRVRALHNLRNVGSKLASDSAYREDTWKQGMDYIPQKHQRQAQALSNGFDRQVKKSIIQGNNDIEKLREWEQSIEAGKSFDDMTIGEAKEIIKQLEERSATVVDEPEIPKKITRPTEVKRVYGSFGNHTWTGATGGTLTRESFDDHIVIKRGNRKFY